jgi:serine/threonine-protein kinase
MKRLDIHYGWHGALFEPFDGPVTTVPVQEGPVVTMSIGAWGGLPDRTLFSGRVFFGTGRVYARFSEARLPSGEVAPVCLEMYQNADLGVPMEKGSTSARSLIGSSVSVAPVLRFGQDN